MANTPPPRPQPRNAYRSLGKSNSNSAAAKRLAEQQAERNIGDIPRKDKYGISGMGENYSGVFNKDKKSLDAYLKTVPGIHKGIPYEMSKRGNIKSYVPVFKGYVGAMKPRRVGGY